MKVIDRKLIKINDKIRVWNDFPIVKTVTKVEGNWVTAGGMQFYIWDECKYDESLKMYPTVERTFTVVDEDDIALLNLQS